MRTKKEDTVRFVLIGLTLFFAIVGVFVIKPYAISVITGLILAFILNPVYKFLLRFLKNKGFTSAIVCILIVVLLAGVGLVLVSALANQATSAYLTISRFLMESEFTNNALSEFLYTKFGFSFNFNQLIAGALSSVVSGSQKIVTSITSYAVSFTVSIFSLFFFLNDKDTLRDKFIRISPIPEELTHKLFKQMGNVTSALIFGIFVTGLIQGILAGIGYVIFGVSSPLIWTLMTIFFAWIPLLGPPIIYVPISIVMILIEIKTGGWLKGIFLLGYCLFFVSTLDNFIRPKLVGDRADIHPLVVFIGILGGIKLFGFVGLIIGPLILELFMFSANLYADYIKEKEILQELEKEKCHKKRNDDNKSSLMILTEHIKKKVGFK
ncbi:AI-2E family transporter [Candidatus Woesearchaeota archaeon]|nr:AI-2E family transporter [Candidatus Woesearchaeota archaeon]